MLCPIVQFSGHYVCWLKSLSTDILFIMLPIWSWYDFSCGFTIRNGPKLKEENSERWAASWRMKEILERLLGGRVFGNLSTLSRLSLADGSCEVSNVWHEDQVP